MTATATDDAPTTVAGAAQDPPRPEPLGGLAGVLGSGDHKTIGRLWVGTAFLFLLVAVVTGALLGIERADLSDLDVLATDTALPVFSLHSVAGVFLFAFPLLIGLATVVVPLQVGAATVAFPRAAAVSYWTFLTSGGIVLAAFGADGGPFGSDSDAVGLFIAAMVPLLASLTLGSVCVATTALALRTPGMSLRRVPAFSWSTIVAATVWALTLPVLAGLLVLAYVDLRYGQHFLGGAGGLYPRLAWMWEQPALYAVAIPALGIVADVVPVAARTRLTRHTVALGTVGVFGVLAFGAWAMPGFDADSALRYVGEAPYYAYSFAIVLPVLALVGLVADTIRRGSVRAISPLFWVVGALLMLLAGIANGALVSIEDLDLVGTTAQTAQAHYVLLAVVLAAAGGLTFWAPKVFGRTLPEGLSKLLAVGALLGTVLFALPDVITGLMDQVRFLGGAPDDIETIEALNIVSAAGGILVGAVILGFVGLLARAAAGGAPAPDDPWDGHTLEWATASPPPVGNFTSVPEVTSEAPLYDARYASEASS